MAQEPRMDARIARRITHKKKQLDTYRPLETFTVQQYFQEANTQPRGRPRG